MNCFKKCQDAVSILESESEILMYELAPADWAVFSKRVEELKSYLEALEADYSYE